jgi:hypothetical protein
MAPLFTPAGFARLQSLKRDSYSASITRQSLRSRHIGSCDLATKMRTRGCLSIASTGDLPVTPESYLPRL